MIWVGMCPSPWLAFVYVTWAMNTYEFNFFLAVLPDCTGTKKQSNTGRQIAYKDDE